MNSIFNSVLREVEGALKAGNWERVKELAVRDRLGKDELKAVARKYASERDAFHYEDFKTILQSCSEKTVKSVFRCVLEENLWRSVGVFLEQRVADELPSKAVTKALAHADSADLSSILPRCTVAQFDEVFQAAVARRIWGAVSGLLAREKPERTWTLRSRKVPLASDEQRKEAFDAVITDKGVEDQHLCLILLCCAAQPSLQDRCLKEAAIRNQWLAVCRTLNLRQEAFNAADSGLLRRTVKMTRCSRRVQTSWLDGVNKWAFEQALQRAKEDTLMNDFLPLCSPQMVVPALEELVRRKFWKAALSVLNISESGAAQPSTHATQNSHASDMNPDDKMFDEILRECMKREFWSVVCELCKHGFDEKQRTLVLENVPEHVGVCVSSLDVSRHGPSDQLQSVLALLAAISTEDPPRSCK